MIKHSLLLLIVLIALIGCKKDIDEPADVNADYSKGAYISNEGSYGNNNGSISYVSKTGDLTNTLYSLVNQLVLGDVVQSINIVDDRGYIVVNNSQKIEVVDLTSFSRVGTITGCDYPRYMIKVDEHKAYISNGSMAGELLVLDLNTLTIENSISVGNGPEKMVLMGDKLFVVNSGGWLEDNSVSVINVNTDELIETIIVGDRPMDIVSSSNNEVWVLCSGKTTYDDNWNVIGNSPAGIYFIDPLELSVNDSLMIGALGDHPTEMEISPDGDTFYVANNGLLAGDVLSVENGLEMISSLPIGAMSVHPDGGIWVTDVSDYVSNGTLKELSPEGNELRSYTVGIAPNSIGFSN